MSKNSGLPAENDCGRWHFIDPHQDCPDKLIWALIGWMAWTDNHLAYEDALNELQDMLTYVFEHALPGQREDREDERKKAAD